MTKIAIPHIHGKNPLKCYPIMLRILQLIPIKVKASYGYHVKCGRISVFQGWPYIVSNVITSGINV